jgi:hypothetical protein
MESPIFGTAAAPESYPDAEHQLDLVRSAIALLATGGARRVTLVNLALSEGTLREAGGLARAAGMLLRIAPRGAASDITVEASG